MTEKQKDLDDLQESIGGLSCYQLMVCIAASYVGFSGSAASQTGIYLSAVPTFRFASLFYCFKWNKGTKSDRSLSWSV